MSVDNKIQKQVIKEISKILDKKKAKIIEKSIYNFSENVATENETPFLIEQIYNTKKDEILKQLNYSKILVQRIKDNEIDASNIAFLKVEELHPEKYEKILKKRSIVEAKKKNKATTTAFKCPKCKNNKTEVEEKQTRAADEPATLFITCTVCGHEWTIG